MADSSDTAQQRISRVQLLRNSPVLQSHCPVPIYKTNQPTMAPTHPDRPFYYYYTRPYSWFAGQIVLFVLGSIGVISWKMFGQEDPLSFNIWILFFTVQLANILTDPDIAIRKTRKGVDGEEVRVKRPLVGFTRCERLVTEAPEDYDGRPGGWRFDRAYLRV